jgi:glyoxylase-like metal-dependent hydrolase (beta-lactamase superfamily II)
MMLKDPPVEITDRLLMLGTSEYPLYVYRGRRSTTIFEGGVGAVGPVLLEQLGRAGIAADLVRQVVVTHAHPDHVMAVPLLGRVFPGIAVLASEVAAKTLAAEKVVAFFRQVDEAITRSLAQAGRIGPEHRGEAPPDGRIAVDRIIGEGDTVSVDDETAFVVLATPGHSECSLSFHEPRQKLLVISDATGYYLPEGDWFWPNYFSDYGAYVGSMKRLAGLGAQVLCLSHNAAIKGVADVRAYFDKAIAATEAYHARIVAEAKEGRPVRQIAEQLGAEVYARTQLMSLEFFQKNCGLLVKLSLRHEGIGADK